VKTKNLVIEIVGVFQEMESLSLRGAFVFYSTFSKHKLEREAFEFSHDHTAAPMRKGDLFHGEGRPFHRNNVS
jgi:hypothetical protein